MTPLLLPVLLLTLHTRAPGACSALGTCPRPVEPFAVQLLTSQDAWTHRMREVLPGPLVPVVAGLADGTVTGLLGPGYARVVVKVVK